MGAAALPPITLAPGPDGLLHSWQDSFRRQEPRQRFLIWLYHPLIDWVIHWRWAAFSGAAIVAWVFFPWNWAVRTGCRMEN